MLSIIKKIIPKPFLDFYHLAISYIAAVKYGFPSEKLIVIGVTGTNGKSTVVNLIAKILETAGHKVGFTSTVNFSVPGQERLNDLKMTMPGRFFLQKIMSQMVASDCRYAIIESTSEGVLQSRQKNIHYDVMVFTNLTPEHLDRHGGFENYKKAKLEYFSQLQKLPHKNLKGTPVPKTIVANLDDPLGGKFLDFKVDEKFGFTAQAGVNLPKDWKIVQAQDVRTDIAGNKFRVLDVDFFSPLAGRFNLENCLAAISVAISQKIDLPTIKQALAKVTLVPGRMENISLGQDFSVMVDYAPEPASLTALYETIGAWSKKRLIHVLGSTGGGRDRSRRQILGQIAGRNADIVIITNEDPYDDDPRKIIEEVAAGAEEVGKLPGDDLLSILSRREAIKKALELAQKGDLVLVTGKGSEQAIVGRGGKKTPWDDRVVVREELEKIVKKRPSK